MLMLLCTVMFMHLDIAKMDRASFFDLQPPSHDECKKQAIIPLSMVIVVQSKNRSMSSMPQGWPGPTQALLVTPPHPKQATTIGVATLTQFFPCLGCPSPPIAASRHMESHLFLHFAPHTLLDLTHKKARCNLVIVLKVPLGNTSYARW